MIVIFCNPGMQMKVPFGMPEVICSQAVQGFDRKLTPANKRAIDAVYNDPAPKRWDDILAKSISARKIYSNARVMLHESGEIVFVYQGVSTLDGSLHWILLGRYASRVSL